MNTNTDNKVDLNENDTYGSERVVLYPEFIRKGQFDKAYASVEKALTQRKLMGHKRPRLEAIFSRTGAGEIEFSKGIEMNKATGWLGRVFKELPSSYDMCFVNYYADGDASIKEHNDTDPELTGAAITISVGDTRDFKYRTRDGLNTASLDDGSALWYNGDAVAHSVPKTKKEVGPRLSFTFRQSRSGSLPG